MIMRVLVTVMTYPTLSKNHFETVCTAGFRVDGSWIRIYPVPHRLLYLQDMPKYKKWQWIEVDLEKNPNDNRPESYHIKNIDTLRILEKLDGVKIDWDNRYRWITKNKIVYDDMTGLLEETKNNLVSLAVLRPTEFVDFTYEEVDMTGYNEMLAKYQKKYDAERRQLSLFDDKKSINDSFVFAKKIPFRFKYVFKTKDGKERRMMIEDWEIGMLFLNSYKNSKANTQEEKYQEAISKVRDKYWGFVQKEEVLLLIGTQYKWHNLNAPNPYVIIGVFHCPKNRQLSLF